MSDADICDAIRVPLSLTAPMDRNPGVDWSPADDALLGFSNQAGEDNRNVARISMLLADMPKTTSGSQ